MRPASRPRWQQVTALVSLSAGGAITGFSFVPRAAADLASPTGLPIRLLALKQSAHQAPANDAMLRSAIVNVADYYLRMAKDRTPADMEAIIWQNDSIDGVDHGASCAAFASLTLEMAAQVVGQQSWVTGGTSYPWPLHKWADVRVDPNPASPGVISLRQDAEAHHRWHPLGDGYAPQPGDWVLFNGHVEVIRKYVGGVLHTVGGNSLPNFSVNAHEYHDPLGAQGVAGFVNNGELAGTANEPAGAASKTPPGRAHGSGGHRALDQAQDQAQEQAQDQADQGLAAIPGVPAAKPPKSARPQRSGGAASPAKQARRQSRQRQGSTSAGRKSPDRAGAGQAVSADVPGTGFSGAGFSRAGLSGSGLPGSGLSGPADRRHGATPGTAAIPGLSMGTHHRPAGRKAPSAVPYHRHHPSPAATPLHDTTAQQAFIGQVAPGAVAAQRRYGVPAAVTIAQAIDESGWGRSNLATRDHNLFGIKGTGPAGSDVQPTQEYDNGRSVTRTAPFRVYHNIAESIDDHGKLLATSGYYRRPMAADRHDPNAFAAALTGVYATDPSYGAKLIGLMRRYDLYRYDTIARGDTSPAATAAGTTAAGPAHADRASAASTSPAAPSSSATPGPARQSAAYRPTSAARSAAQTMPSAETVSARPVLAPVSYQPRQAVSRNARARRRQYQDSVPASVRNSFMTMARVPLLRAEPLYRDVASYSGIRWELLAACDWMQCAAQPRYSPVHGEKLGAVNPDGTTYRTKSAALEQCADDLVALAWAVYRIDLAARGYLSVRDLANVFAAFRWGGLLRLHHTSAMEFPYSVAGLTVQHINMRWPNIAEPNTPDKPGSRFRMPFGAVPIVLGLHYPATA